MNSMEIFFIMLLFAILNHYLVRQSNPLIGGFIPFTFTTLFILNFIFKWVDYSKPEFIVISVIALLVLFGEWSNGRLDYERKRKKEQKKIAKKDMY
ncbi:hypothetical protein [Virgibacillus pantothenticus]|uniref:hypothetical protein n=1 Tax=Virgibacillus pantothenticus TaxID=1473 RepID=UPI000985BAE3|nr:hypothetical protein [Virgibacillus pantothenticus]